MTDKIKELQNLLHQYKIEGYIIPTTDEYQGEYTAPHAKRLEFVTGFTGSNGFAIITQKHGLFFTDGRYLTQSQQELDTNFFDIFDITNINETDFSQYIHMNDQIGFDPLLYTPTQLKRYSKIWNLVSINENLIDKIWHDQPNKANSAVFLYGEKFAGMSYRSKINLIREKLKEQNLDHFILTCSDSIAWLLNIRAHDVEYSPLMHGYVILSSDKCLCFTQQNRISTEIHNFFGDNILFLEENKIYSYLSQLEGNFGYEENSCPIKLTYHVKAESLITTVDPCQVPKAIKNNIEIKHAKEGHIKDGVALCEFFAWLENTINNRSDLTEYDLCQKLEDFRKQQQNFISSSFPAICGFNENGAIIHYRAQQNSAKQIKNQGLLLLDSGGQYLGCTTDVTRVISLGSPSQEQKIQYTRVLKGHIALAQIKFPKGTNGGQLDVLARQYLWEYGQNYAHGTGHGVGSFLGVHEGPQSIGGNNKVILEPGMILSNEPGFYKVDEYGIRIENLILVEQSPYENFLQFQNLTLVPYCSALIEKSLLTNHEIMFLDNYYKQFQDLVMPYLSIDATSWAKKQIKL